jgi:inorganic triphosphatase YgiF
MKFKEQFLLNSLLLESDDLIYEFPEFGSDVYTKELERMIRELQTLKKTMSKGKDRDKYRKEKSRLQHAIESLRYLKNKNQRVLERQNDN